MIDGLALYAYKVGPGPCEFPYGCLVYADTPERACAIAAPELNGDAVDLVAERAPEHDARAPACLHARIEQDPEYLRTAGWQLEDERTCDSCGLAAMGMEKYAVCRDSGTCRECGCADDEDDEGRTHPCVHAEGFSGE